MKRLNHIVLVVLAALVAFAAFPLSAGVAGAGAVPLAITSAGVTIGASYARITSRVTGSPTSVSVTILSPSKGTVRTYSALPVGAYHVVSWNLRNVRGERVADGTYSYRIVARRGAVATARTGTLPVRATSSAASANPSGRWVGFYQSGSPSSMTPLQTLETQIGQKSKVVNFYVADSESFPVNRTRSITDGGRIPMITWEFWSLAGSGGVTAISNGSKDAYIRAFADAAKATGKTIYLRPLHEMNSNWYPWAGATNGNTPAAVVAAWKRIRTIFSQRGATNVRFVWCVNSESVPNTTANAIKAYWPGDAYVDILAIDGYNFGTAKSWSAWKSFSAVIGPSYAAVTALSAKPLIIAETGSVPQGGDKAAWIEGMFSAISTKYTRIRGVCWFNVNDTGEATDWRCNATSATTAAFKRGAAAY